MMKIGYYGTIQSGLKNKIMKNEIKTAKYIFHYEGNTIESEELQDIQDIIDDIKFNEIEDKLEKIMQFCEANDIKRLNIGKYGTYQQYELAGESISYYFMDGVEQVDEIEIDEDKFEEITSEIYENFSIDEDDIENYFGGLDGQNLIVLERDEDGIAILTTQFFRI